VFRLLRCEVRGSTKPTAACLCLQTKRARLSLLAAHMHSEAIEVKGKRLRKAKVGEEAHVRTLGSHCTSLARSLAAERHFDCLWWQGAEVDVPKLEDEHFHLFLSQCVAPRPCLSQPCSFAWLCSFAWPRVALLAQCVGHGSGSDAHNQDASTGDGMSPHAPNAQRWDMMPTQVCAWRRVRRRRCRICVSSLVGRRASRILAAGASNPLPCARMVTRVLGAA
jgi:hypothetical protein